MLGSPCIAGWAVSNQIICQNKAAPASGEIGAADIIAFVRPQRSYFRMIIPVLPALFETVRKQPAVPAVPFAVSL